MPVKNALVVDDSKSARLMLQRLLSRMNVQVDLVESAEAALKFLETQSPDVIFMDHMMPGMDGLEATQLIKANPKTAAIPTIMYTSKEGDDYVQEARSHGAHGVLPKPANQEAVMAVMAALDAPAANDEKPNNNIALAEVDRLVQRQLKRALTEAKGEIAAGLDSTTQQLQQAQHHELERLQQNLQTTLQQELVQQLTPEALFAKTQKQQQRVAIQVAKQMSERQSERLLLQLQQSEERQQQALQQLQAQQQQQLKRAMMVASVAGTVLGATIAIVISALI
ncbi:response regulator [Bacterioplanes sanyensis]|nr:response regulator [Bacterioplanes sanyensis]